MADDHAPRILGGTLKGRRLAVADGRITRPLKVLARRSLFDSIQNRIPDARVLDLFAGAGTIGFEAASRGAARVVLVEFGRLALRALERSRDELRLTDRVEIVAADAVAFVKAAAAAQFDFVFCGPPYAFFRGEARAHLNVLLAGLPRLLAPNALLVIETPSAIAAPLLSLPLHRSRAHGESTLHEFLATPLQDTPDPVS
jgi:16S rRNA (guanine966-N2)-methyltransferase